MAAKLTGKLGESVLRLEDPPLITGRGRFAADISFPHQLHMRIVRSNWAHAKITRIETTAAKALPGVHAVWTADDITDVPPIEFREGHIENLAPYRQRALGTGTVRYVGEPIAAVFADDAYVAEDAAELIEVEAEELPVITDASAPPAEFSPGQSTEADIVRQGYGDVDAAFAEAAHIVEAEINVGRHSGVPLETRGAIARFDASRDVLELHGAAKVPHRNRETLATMFDRPIAAVQLYESHVGGGFGVRGELYPEDILVCVATLRFGRAVKWIEDRHEHLMATNHSRQQLHRVRAALDKDGMLLAVDDTFFHDQGGYVRTHAIRVPMMTCGILLGPYKVANYRAAGHVRLTNKTPAATYRSPGRFETTFVRERLMDIIAREIGMDAMELRRRNLVRKEDMPYAIPLQVLGDDVEYDTGDYERLLDMTMDHFDWTGIQADIERRREAGETVGSGISLFVEKSGLGPSDMSRISVDRTGAVEVITGGASIGQGFETCMAQICADALGVDYRNIRVVHGQTERIDHGVGAHASRATVLTGSAVNEAALLVRAKALDVAAEQLQAPVDTLDIVDGQVFRTDDPDGPSISLGEISQILAPTRAQPEGRDPLLAADGWFYTDHQTYPYGLHLAVVKIDRETGGIKVERFLVGYDIGRAVNPMLVEGQIAGGFAQGLGGAMFEEFVYDERGQPQSVTFADYLLPTVGETPAVEMLLREDFKSSRNPLGIKGAGEAGVTGVGAAIASAVDDAIGLPGAVTQLPITPQRLKAILNAAG
ncbi:MAG: xanthine dehydrogenase family protein molybdopterin-binding subunit [Alphaproteobacteria bacterium]